MSGVLVFGRQPVAGRVKTRLAAEVGARTAARVYEVLLDHTIAEARASGLAVELWLAEAPDPEWAGRLELPWRVQAAGDLGTRMAGAFADCFARGWRWAVIVGSDCPGLGSGDLEAAAAGLERHCCVLGPAADGGYWLIGQRSPGFDLFSGVPWSAVDTLEVTKRRLAELGLDWRELDRRVDVDSLEDLRAVVAADGLSRSVGRRVRAAMAEER